MRQKNFPRVLILPQRSFFLFGPRGVGKSTWLKQVLGNATTINLLKNDEYLELSRATHLLEAKIGSQKRGSWICIDEVQKVPALLDEVHRLIEEKGFRFALSGSSARKLKRGGANLLGGRAVTRTLSGFSWVEIKSIFQLGRTLEWGSLPLIVLNKGQEQDLLNSYVHTYIKEEIKEEGIVRKVEPFLRFLEVAGLLNGQQINAQNISRDAHVARSTIDTYLSILEDTLLASFLRPYQPQAKVREQTHPKMYFFDIGVARAAAGLLYNQIDQTWLGISLESLIFNELRIYNSLTNKHYPFHYYRTDAGSEIDFVVEVQKRTQTQKAKIICIEVKHSTRWRSQWERPMRSLAATGKLIVQKMVCVYRGKEKLTFGDLTVYPAEMFLQALHEGNIF